MSNEVLCFSVQNKLQEQFQIKIDFSCIFSLFLLDYITANFSYLKKGNNHSLQNLANIVDANAIRILINFCHGDNASVHAYFIVMEENIFFDNAEVFLLECA